MPTAPMLPPDQMPSAPVGQQMGGVSPAHYLMAAADLHQSGSLSSPVPAGVPLQTGKMPKGAKKLRVVR